MDVFNKNSLWDELENETKNETKNETRNETSNETVNELENKSNNQMNQGIKIVVTRFWKDESGMGLVEIAIIIIIIIALAVFFQEQIMNLIEKIFSNINMNVNKIS